MVLAWWRGNWKRLSVAVAASICFWYYAMTPTDWHFLDGVNLIIHEAGHIIFIPLGHFLNILGGSLMQILIPCVFSAYFFVHRQYFSASLLLFWIGQNVINVSLYASDSIVMQLPLIGGDNVIHDWNEILSMLHILRHAYGIGHTMYGIGTLIILLGIALSIQTSQHKSDMITSTF